MTITYKIAMAAGRDAANRQMKAAGRTSWNEDDWNAAAKVTEELMGARKS
jgi:hypothetical protein